MAQNKHVSVVADSDSKQVTRVPNSRPYPPLISLTNVVLDFGDGKKEKVDLNITLPVNLLADITRESVRELKSLQESAKVEVG